MLVWWLLQKAPISWQLERIIAVSKTSDQVTLLPGDVLKQKFRTNGGTFSGVVISSFSPQLNGQKILVKILDRDGHELTRSLSYRTYYLPADDKLRIELKFPWITVKPQQELYEEISFTGGSPLAIKASGLHNTKVYPTGRLFINNQPVDRDIAVALIKPVPLFEGGKQGVLAGLIFTLAFALILVVVPKKRQWLAAAVLFVCVTPLTLGGFWFSDDALGISDWDYYFSLHHYYRETILKYHQFPLWNPWTCGGTAGLGDPEFPLFSPTYLVEFLLGIPNGLRIAIFVSVAGTALGFLALGKRLNLSLPAAVLATLGGAFGTVSLLEIVEGHVNVFAAMWIPWIFLAWLCAYRQRVADTTAQTATINQSYFLLNKWEILCAFFLALTFYAGGIYLLMYTILAFIMLELFVTRRLIAFMVTARAGVLALGLSALKLWPVLFWLNQFPDKSYASSTVTIQSWVDILLGRYLHGTYIIFQQDSGWHEYGAYIGPFILALALLGITQIRKSRIVRSLLVGGVMVLLLSATGPAVKKLFDLLWFFPRSNISRIILFAIIPFSLLAGFGLDVLRAKFKPIAWWLVLLLVGLTAVDLMSLDYQLSQQSFVLPHVYPLISPAPSPIAFTPRRYDDLGDSSSHTRAYDAAVAGYGTMTYCSVLGPGQEGGVRTVYDEGGNGAVVAQASSATVTILSWTPNRVVVHVITPVKTDVALNTNYVKGWVVNNQPAVERGNLVATSVDSGDHILVFTYQSPGLFIGITISSMTVVLLLFGWLSFRTKRKNPL